MAGLRCGGLSGGAGIRVPVMLPLGIVPRGAPEGQGGGGYLSAAGL